MGTKPTSGGQWTEFSSNLVRVRQEIPLTDAERAAVEDGTETAKRPVTTLAKVPTPARDARPGAGA
jgi:hypothetical protein